MKIPSGRSLTADSAGYALLKRLEESNKPVVAVDVADAVTASLISAAHSDYFEGFWISSLGVSLRMGFEDAYTLNSRDYAQLISDIKLISPNEHIVVDADNGGQSYKNAQYAYKHYSALGVSVAFMENKSGIKFNSLAESSAHTLENRDSFAAKVEAAKKTQNKTLVGIRLEDAIVADYNPEQALSEAIKTTQYYMANAKPDFFLFHWKKETADVPVEFAKRYFEAFKNEADLPYLACVPTTYSKSISNTKLGEAGYRLIILGNPVLRAQMKAARDVAKTIAESDSLVEADKNVFPLKELMKINNTL